MKKIMFNEVWKPMHLNGCDLDISNFGNIRFSKNKKPKAFHLNEYGYPTIHIRQNGKVYAYLIHRLVAMLFVDNPNPQKYDCINHKDENPSNNHFYNMEWCDRKYNNNYGSHNQKIAKSHSKPIIQYDLNGNIVKKWDSATSAARELGYSQSCINWCCLRKPKYNSYKGYIWRYTGDDDISYTNGKRIIKMDFNGNIIKEYFNITEASKENGILQTSISNCIHGRSQSAGGFIWKLK